MTGKNIRICFLMHKAYPVFNEKILDVSGGAEINMVNLAKQLSQTEKYKIVFFVGDYGQPLEEQFGNIIVRKYRYSDTRRYKRLYHKLLRLLVLWKELLSFDSEVYITSAAGKLLGWVVLIEKVLKRKKVIYRLASDVDADLSYCKAKGGSLYRLFKFGFFNASVRICQTERQKELLMSKLGLEGIVVKNGFFLNRSADIKGKRTILWISRYDTMKRPELFIELAKRLPEEDFVIVMPCDKKTTPDILIHKNFPANVKYVGFVPFSETYEYYFNAKLLVNTSEYEGFPNSFIQACIAKTPILSFRVNPDNFIYENNLGFVCNDDLDMAVEFIKGLDEEKLLFYGNNAFDYVKENHNIETSAAAYEEVIRRMLEKK